ncbi:MAG: NAD(P)/FAD-dependent oxidoreductase [Myxococcales bacterium]|nr:NAD(P)/FAD-dependent oxidoreductase [Myxococcales bacterium]
MTKRVIIVGGGFAGLNAAKGLANARDIDVILIDERNHHLFQPLLYQVATAGLSPAEIAEPIRGILSRARNIRVLRERVLDVDLSKRVVVSDAGDHPYDYLILACGSKHAYFGNEAWEEYAPGLKTLEQATEIRRRVLSAFEEAEKETKPEVKRSLLTFVIVGGGPTGVELAGAIGEMSHFTLTRDFRQIDPALARIILIEAGPRILPTFDDKLAARAVRDLESLGVQIWTESPVTDIDASGLDVGSKRLACRTVLWAAGVKASSLGLRLGAKLDRQRRVMVGGDLSLPGHPEVFIAGDQAHVADENGNPLPGMAPAALQQGRYLARRIRKMVRGGSYPDFRFHDKGQMATIGRRRAILESGNIKFAGITAWAAWLVIHIYYLAGFKNRLFVVLQWVWSYFTYRRGARLIVGKDWRFYPEETDDSVERQ